MSRYTVKNTWIVRAPDYQLSHLIFKRPTKQKWHTFRWKWANKSTTMNQQTLWKANVKYTRSRGVTAPARERRLRAFPSALFPPLDTFDGRVTRWHKTAVTTLLSSGSGWLKCQYRFTWLLVMPRRTKHFRPEECHGTTRWWKYARRCSQRILSKNAQLPTTFIRHIHIRDVLLPHLRKLQ